MPVEEISEKLFIKNDDLTYVEKDMKKPYEQLLINIVTNAVEASLESQPDGGGQVSMGWQADDAGLQIWVEDDGPGLTQGNEVFVPFFTTKLHGSGIWLALSRQIAEAHGGLLTLENRPDGSGCRACLTLPLP